MHRIKKEASKTSVLFINKQQYNFHKSILKNKDYGCIEKQPANSVILKPENDSSDESEIDSNSESNSINYKSIKSNYGGKKCYKNRDKKSIVE